MKTIMSPQLMSGERELSFNFFLNRLDLGYSRKSIWGNMFEKPFILQQPHRFPFLMLPGQKTNLVFSGI